MEANSRTDDAPSPPEGSGASPAPSPTRPNRATEGAGGLRARLTPEYLEGEWCALYSQERSRYVFASDGSYRAGLAAPGHLLDTQGTIETLLAEFNVIELEADRFVLARENAYWQYVFGRGPC